jgi:TIR domain
VFVSHDSRDHELAEHFCDLLEGVSSKMIESFCSSDHRKSSGVEYGKDWEKIIRKKLRNATDVVVLLTPNSLSRPWVFFEVGIAAGYERATVVGVTLGATMAEITASPFNLLRNCQNDEDLVKFLLTLVRGRSQLRPKESTVRHEVLEFRQKVATLHSGASGAKTSDPSLEEGLEVAARMLEEVKLLAEDLRRNRSAQLLGPKLFEEFPLVRPDGYDATGWLIFLGILRRDLPWFYEVGLELYRAIAAGDPDRIRPAKEKVLRAVRAATQNEWLRTAIWDDNRELALRLFNLPDLVESYLSQLEPPGDRS